MTHLDEGRIVALRDDHGWADAEAREHLEGCAACREALDATRLRGVRISGALESLDAPLASVEEARERVRQRVAAESARRAGTPSLTTRRARRTAWSASKAAGILLVTAAGLSALPGSPVRRWVSGLVGPDAPSGAATAPAPDPASTAATAEAVEEAGVRLPITRGPLSVVLREVAPGTEIRVRWNPGLEAAVFAPVGSRFTSGEGRVEATGLGGVVRVELPRSVLPVFLEVNGRTVLRNGAGGLEVSGPVVDRDDAGVTFRLPLP